MEESRLGTGEERILSSGEADTEADENMAEFEQLLLEYRGAKIEGEAETVQDSLVKTFAWVMDHPPRELSKPAQINRKARACEERADWEGAQAAYQQMLAASWIEENERVRQGQVFKAHQERSGLFTLLGRDDLALEEARKAAEAARLSDLTPLICAALETQAECLFRLGEWGASQNLAQEILQLVGQKGEERALYDLHTARALTIRAACQVQPGDLAAAAEDLKEAWRILEPQAPMLFAAGIQSAVIRWWTATALLRAGSGDKRGAVTAWQEAVERSRQFSGSARGKNWLAIRLQELAQALRAVGEIAAAQEAHHESLALRQALGLPQEETAAY